MIDNANSFDYRFLKKQPFFSVCIEVYNREKTIEKVIKSIANQICKDFELIVVDNGSTDSSAVIIEENLKKLPLIPSLFIRENRKLNEIEGWNRPLYFARGKYIAICEGDDYYDPYHLIDAKKEISIRDNIGIYIGGHKLTRYETHIQITEANVKLKQLKVFEWAPPPSCLIFKRISPSGAPYYFDENFVWAAEYSLYFWILNDGFLTIENFRKNYVTRDSRYYPKNSFHLQDILRIRHGTFFNYNDEEACIADSKISNLAFQYWAFNLGLGKLELKTLGIFLKHTSTLRILKNIASQKFLFYISLGFRQFLKELLKNE